MCVYGANGNNTTSVNLDARKISCLVLPTFLGLPLGTNPSTILSYSPPSAPEGDQWLVVPLPGSVQTLAQRVRWEAAFGEDIGADGGQVRNTDLCPNSVDLNP